MANPKIKAGQIDILDLQGAGLGGGNVGKMVTDPDAPVVSETSFSVSGLSEEVWRSVGPTGSPTVAQETWAALDDVPEGADWIRVRIRIYATDLGQAANTGRIALMNAAPFGYTGSADNTRTVAECSYYTSSAGNGRSSNIVEATIPLDSARRFNVRWNTTAIQTISIEMWLVGYGYNDA